MDAKDTFVELGNSIAKLFNNLGNALKPADVESGWFYHLIIDLVKSDLSCYDRLVKYYTVSDYHLLAGACRNLLELAIFTKYVLISEANARKFCEDRLIDGCELIAAMKNVALHCERGSFTI